MSHSSPMQNLPTMESGLDAGRQGTPHESGEVTSAPAEDQVTSDDDVTQTPDIQNSCSKMSSHNQFNVHIDDEDIEMSFSEADESTPRPLSVIRAAPTPTIGELLAAQAGNVLPGSTSGLAENQTRRGITPPLIAPRPRRMSSLLSMARAWELDDRVPLQHHVPIMTDETMTSTPEVPPESWPIEEPSQPKYVGLHFPSVATDPALAGLREISSMASWKVSSSKPGCGVDALRNPTTATFWQSDGPQPHFLNIHFIKMVHIVKLRIYLDFESDESYTPTRISFCAGTHAYDAIEFAEWRWQDAGPKGWIEVDLSQCGSEEDHRALAKQYGSDPEALKGKGVLHCMFLQVRVLENHQNGKDTHIRGVQVFARDERIAKNNAPIAQPGTADANIERLRQELEESEWMKEPELR